jgi:CHAD domain-containing protein
MPAEIQVRRDAGEQVRQTAIRQLEKALKALTRQARTPRSQDTSVHTARKRLKEVRALLRLVRKDLGKIVFTQNNRDLRDIARPLSELRDATALLHALESLRLQGTGKLKKRPYEVVRKVLRTRRTFLRRRIIDSEGTLKKAAAELQLVHNRVNHWNFTHGTWHLLVPGLRDTYAKGQRAMRIAHRTPADEHLHEWRKRTKDLRNQLELLEPLWPVQMKSPADTARKVTDLLGDDHDLAVLLAVIESVATEVPADVVFALQNVVNRRRGELQGLAKSLGARLYAQRASAFGETRARRLKPARTSRM